MQAFVNHSRWIVSCPCGSAKMVGYTERGFLCVECGARAPIEWPDQSIVRRIESLLMARPIPVNRNWTPGETVGDLMAENIEHGIEAP